jgi:DNA-binding MarR family transcriptional regulator
MEKRETIAKIIGLQRQHGEIMRQHSFPHWMKLGLTAVQFKSLLYIVKTGDGNSKKLSDILGVTPANVTGVIDRLIGQGLVQRVENPEDRRVAILHATDKGKKLITNLEENTVEHMAKLLSSLNEEELDHLYKGLSAFLTALENRHQNTTSEI